MIKNVIVLNGMNGESDIPGVILSFLKKENYICSQLDLKDMHIEPCINCKACAKSQTGLCISEDETNVFIKAFINSDLAIFLTPVIFGSVSSSLKKVMDKIGGSCVSPTFAMRNGYLIHPNRYLTAHPKHFYIGIFDNINEADSFSFMISRIRLILGENFIPFKMLKKGIKDDMLLNAVKEGIKEVEEYE